MDKHGILIADDHPVVRSGIRKTIERLENVEVLAESGDGEETMSLIKDLRPDILLIDISMPSLSGLEVLERTRKEFPEIRVALISVHDDEEYVIRAIEEGATAYIPKNSNESELLKAIKMVMKGETYFGQELNEVLINGIKKKSQYVKKGLTEREHEVLRLIVKGLSSKEIGERLFISERTVHTHRNNIMKKLKVNNVVELCRTALDKELV
jgi:DNA-binding NarL/FixJ family response regulator